MSKPKTYKVQTNVNADMIKILNNRIEKENVTMSEYLRGILYKTLTSDTTVSLGDHIVGFNRSNNDKVTNTSRPATFKRMKMKRLWINNV